MRIIALALALLLAACCTACNSAGATPSPPLTAPAASDPPAVEQPRAPQPPTTASPLPATLPAPAALREVSWEAGNRLVYGAMFIDTLPHQNIEPATNGTSALFSAAWLDSPAPTSADLAFGIYAIYYASFALDAPLTVGWITPPEQNNGAYIGLANFTANRWNWWPADGSPLEIEQFYDYRLDDVTYIAVVTLESGPLELSWLRLFGELHTDVVFEADPTAIELGDTVNFTLEGTVDPELDIVGYEISFGDGTPRFMSATEQTTQHVYNTAGPLTAVARVKHGNGDIVTEQLTINVSPFATTELDATGYSPSLFIDPDGLPLLSYSGGAEHNELRLATLGEPPEIRQLAVLAGEEDVETALICTPDSTEIAFGNTVLYYGFINENFEYRLVDGAKAPGKPAVGRNEDNWPLVFFSRFDGGQPRLAGAYLAGSVWQVETLAGETPSGRFCDGRISDQVGALCVYAGDEGELAGRLMYGRWTLDDGWTASAARHDMHPTRNRVSYGKEISGQAVYISDPAGDGTSAVATHIWSIWGGWETQALQNSARDCDIAYDPDRVEHFIIAVEPADGPGREFWHYWGRNESLRRNYAGATGPGSYGPLEFGIDAAGYGHLCYAFIPEGESTRRMIYRRSVVPLDYPGVP